MFFSYFQQQWFTYRFSLRINVNKKGKYSRVSRDQEIVPKFDQENIVIFVGGEREETRIKQGNKWNVHATSMRLRFENRLYNRLSRSAFFLCAQLFLIGCLSNLCLCSQLEPRVKCPGLLSRFLPCFEFITTRFRLFVVLNKKKKRIFDLSSTIVFKAQTIIIF